MEETTYVNEGTNKEEMVISCNKTTPGEQPSDSKATMKACENEKHNQDESPFVITLSGGMCQMYY